MERFARRAGASAISAVLAFLLAGVPAIATEGLSFGAIEGIVADEMEAGRIPGAVVVVGAGDRIVYRRAFGVQSFSPGAPPLTAETIFDLASLTKVIATTTAVMQLVERGKLALDEPVARYWPRFARRGKGAITLRQLMTHYSGLPPGFDPRWHWKGYAGALERIEALAPARLPGAVFDYSDLNFIVLGELVRRASGLGLDAYCAGEVFGPLGMRDTSFHPSGAARVSDPTARRMGGVAGHAGLFSTADDLAIFAATLLEGGRRGDVALLLPASVAAMAAPQSPVGALPHRGLGWDIDSPFAEAWDHVLPDAYGHTGYTGTALWIDRRSRTFVIVLTNRLRRGTPGDARPLRARIAASVAEAVAAGASREPTQVRTGIDVLESQGFAPLVGRRVGLITNRTGRDAGGRRTIDLLRAAPGVRLAALFSPEHGLDAEQDGKVASGRDESSGLPLYSLYGDARRPSAAMLAGLDTLVFDVQDAGVRFYTYATTMAYAMEEAARRNISFFVLDRPNPIDADVVQGPVLDRDLRSFTGYSTLPVRHGMTIGELARLFNDEERIGADLHVIAMDNYRRSDWYDETGLRWIPPSPNLRSLGEAALYPAVALLEGANVSVGRGTAAPFEVLGAPWIDGPRLASYLNGRAIAGVRFEATEFVPDREPFAGRRCHGVRFLLTDRERLDAPLLGVELANGLRRLHGRSFRLDDTLGSIGSRRVVRAIEAGEDPRVIALGWGNDLARFQEVRRKYLLYR